MPIHSFINSFKLYLFIYLLPNSAVYVCYVLEAQSSIVVYHYGNIALHLWPHRTISRRLPTSGGVWRRPCQASTRQWANNPGRLFHSIFQISVKEFKKFTYENGRSDCTVVEGEGGRVSEFCSRVVEGEGLRVSEFCSRVVGPHRRGDCIVYASVKFNSM